MFSVIIPTLWIKPHITNKLLDIYLKSNYIDEIIIINNSSTTVEFKDKKIVCLDQKENLYVNPSWNLGVSKAKNNKIIISNDDIIIPNNLIDYLNTINLSNYGIIGVHKESYSQLRKIESFNEYSIDKHQIVDYKNIDYGFGTFMVLLKTNYHPIPENIKIYCGDNFLFIKNKNNGAIITDIRTEMSSSSGLKKFNKIKGEDLVIYKKLLK